MATNDAIPEPERMAHVSLPPDAKMSGMEHMGMGKRMRMVMEGRVKGFSTGEHGHSADMKLHMVRMEPMEGDEAEPDDEPTMADVLKSKQKKAH